MTIKPKVFELQTDRLLLRPWRSEDFPLFAQMNADPEVMAYYPSVLNNDESNALAHKFSSLLLNQSWGFWAVEHMDRSEFIGFVGLHKPQYHLPVSPCIEIGWRLAKEYWGNGYATEAAFASLYFAFEQLNLAQVYAFTPVANQKSWSVMQRLGMENTQNNFKHPMIPKHHTLAEHLLYKINKQQYHITAKESLFRVSIKNV